MHVTPLPATLGVRLMTSFTNGAAAQKQPAMGKSRYRRFMEWALAHPWRYSAISSAVLCVLVLGFLSDTIGIQLTQIILGIAVLSGVLGGWSMSRGPGRKGWERQLQKWIDAGERLPERRSLGLFFMVVGTVLLIVAPLATIGNIVQHRAVGWVIEDALSAFGFGLGFLYLGRKLRPRRTSLPSPPSE
jgi:hypothetical protein